MAALFEKIVIVTRRTELEELIVRFNTAAQAKFYLERSGQSIDDIQVAHDRYHRVLGNVRKALDEQRKVHVIDRSQVPQYTFGDSELVITIGQDGLVSNTAKYLDGQPIFAINPDPDRYDGVLLPFVPGTFKAYLAASLAGDLDQKSVTLARASSSTGQELLAFNDFFIGARSHVSARYQIAVGDTAEQHSSSGIIVSTGAGSTGWLQSVYAGAAGVVAAYGGTYVPPENDGRLPWDSEELVFSVREPFPSRVTQCSLVHGRLSRAQPLTLTSRMPTNGVIFSDGVGGRFPGLQLGRHAVDCAGGEENHAADAIACAATLHVGIMTARVRRNG